MNEVILGKYGELALKGQNRRNFEDLLLKNTRNALRPLGDFEISAAQSTVLIRPLSAEIDMDAAFGRVLGVFGYAAAARACVTEKDFEAICLTASSWLSDRLSAGGSFKVEAKRADKSFPLDSPAISRQLGAYLMERYPELTVDVHNPALRVVVEVRDSSAYIHTGSVPAAGGMPAGSGGRAALLISGGIDSPVAGYMMARRGLNLIGVHFVSPPYTSERALLKVQELSKILSPYCGGIRLHVVPFTEIQEQIRDHCPEDLFTLVMRRFMMRIAERIAEADRCLALITGESLGQVASQTLQAITVTDEVATMPVFRPVIGMDKEDIVRMARKIGTFETSIQPYEDCCTVFTPRHPKTKPRLADLVKAEEKLDLEALIEKAVAETEAYNL